MDYATEQVIDNPYDKQKLIHTYMTILKIDYPRTTFDTIIETFKVKFDFEVTREELLIYFEPTLEEFTADLELQFKNLNL